MYGRKRGLSSTGSDLRFRTVSEEMGLLAISIQEMTPLISRASPVWALLCRPGGARDPVVTIAVAQSCLRPDYGVREYLATGSHRRKIPRCPTDVGPVAWVFLLVVGGWWT